MPVPTTHVMMQMKLTNEPCRDGSIPRFAVGTRLTLKTLQYYERNAPQIVQSYEGADLSNLHRIFNQLFIIPFKLLEVGGGSGRDAAFLLRHGHDVVFTDASQSMAHEAIRLHPELRLRALVCKAETILPLADNCFDGVIAIAVLMHLTTPGIVHSLSEMHRVVNHGGLVFISTPACRDDMATDERDQRGRRMTHLDVPALVSACFNDRFALLLQAKNTDGLQRGGLIWHSCCLAKI